MSRQQLVEVQKKKKKKVKVKTQIKQKQKYDSETTGRIHERKCFACGQMLAVLVKIIGWRREVSFVHVKELKWAGRRRAMEEQEQRDLGKKVMTHEKLLRNHDSRRGAVIPRGMQVHIKDIQVPEGAILIGKTYTGEQVLAYPKKK